MSTMSDVVVVGAGVIGLSSAIRLAEAGHRVRVLTDRAVEDTTSVAAGAMLGISGAGPDDPLTAWTERSTPVFEALAEDPATGIHRRHGRIHVDVADELPPWARALPDFRALGPDETRGRVGMAVTLPFADMPTYLAHLADRAARLGVVVEQRHVADLADLAEPGRVVVNAAGSGAGVLAGDPTVTGVRGVHVVLADAGIEEFTMEVVAGPRWTNVFPHPGRVVVGGAALPPDDETPDAQVAEENPRPRDRRRAAPRRRPRCSAARSGGARCGRHRGSRSTTAASSTPTATAGWASPCRGAWPTRSCASSHERASAVVVDQVDRGLLGARPGAVDADVLGEEVLAVVAEDEPSGTLVADLVVAQLAVGVGLVAETVAVVGVLVVGHLAAQAVGQRLALFLLLGRDAPGGGAPGLLVRGDALVERVVEVGVVEGLGLVELLEDGVVVGVGVVPVGDVGRGHVPSVPGAVRSVARQAPGGVRYRAA